MSWRAVCALAIFALLAGCGDGGDDAEPSVGPLPTGPDDPRAYTERFMARNPLALAQLDHLVMVALESTSVGEEDGDTCAEREGVDCLPYAVEEATEIAVSIADDAEDLAELVIVDAAGEVVLRHVSGEDAGIALLGPGSYRLELHHRFAGDAVAPEQAVFLRSDVLDGSGSPASSGAPAATAGAPMTPASAPRMVQLTAQENCQRCDFSGALLTGEHFDDRDLTGAIFNRARVSDTTFVRAKIADGQFVGFVSASAGVTRGTRWEMSTVDADFSGAVLSRTQWSLRALNARRWHFAGVFRGAQLDASVWKGKRLSANDLNLLFNADFRNADLTDSRWEEELTVLRHEEGHQPQCTFQGADLTRAKFTGMIKDHLTHCRFDKEPQSGRRTILRGASLGGANLAGATLAGADLSGATVAEVRWRGANLTDAVLAGMVPATFNDLDLTGTDFTGVDFAGFDLTRTDLSKAVLSIPPRFGSAKLTDGTRGVNIAGHKFPPRYELFKGADLTGVDFSRAELFEANLERTTLNKAKLVGANLNFANLRGAKLRGATLGVQPGSEIHAATLRGAFMPDIDLSDADLRTVDLTGAHLYGDQQQTLLVRTRLDSASLVNAVCSGAHFSGTMNNTVFVGAQLVNAVFNGATLTGAKFDDAYLQGADFANAISVTGASLSNAAVSAAPGTWQFREGDGTPFVFRYEATKLGALASDRSVRCPNGADGPCCPSGDLAACLNGKLKPVRNGPFPPVPECVPKPPRYDNCITPRPTTTPAPTPTPRR